ncbi:uncharacterized protein LOC135309780 [Plodia interpunctella]|uniref:uncharacterized protein LOC135309780 n=1 Tax=Plodia interpunctella TaxID=58824 RepID=UPI00310153BD
MPDCHSRGLGDTVIYLLYIYCCIVRICSSTFTTNEVDIAKALLFDTIKTKRRNISRRRDGKIQRDLEDIIAIFKDTDPETIPTYVARDLHKLPPVTFDHVDVTALLKDILILKRDVEKIKLSYVTNKQVQELENNLLNGRYASIIRPDPECNVNTKRGAYLLDSGPVAFQFQTSGNDESYNGINDVHKRDDGSGDGTGAGAGIVTCAGTQPHLLSSDSDSARLTCGGSEIIASRSHLQEGMPNAVVVSTPTRSRKQTNKVTDSSERKLSYAELVNKDGQWEKSSKQDNEWILVQKKRSRNRFIGSKGKAESSATAKFKAADTKVPLFISNVHKDVSETDIVDYIYAKTKETVSLAKIKMKQQRDYNSYKVFVTKYKLDVFLDDNLWPCGISFRRFVNLRERLKQKGGEVTQKTDDQHEN